MCILPIYVCISTFSTQHIFNKKDGKKNTYVFPSLAVENFFPLYCNSPSQSSSTTYKTETKSTPISETHISAITLSPVLQNFRPKSQIGGTHLSLPKLTSLILFPNLNLSLKIHSCSFQIFMGRQMNSEIWNLRETQNDILSIKYRSFRRERHSKISRISKEFILVCEYVIYVMEWWGDDFRLKEIHLGRIKLVRKLGELRSQLSRFRTAIRWNWLQN